MSGTPATTAGGPDLDEHGRVGRLPAGDEQADRRDRRELLPDDHARPDLPPASRRRSPRAAPRRRRGRSRSRRGSRRGAQGRSRRAWRRALGPDAQVARRDVRSLANRSVASTTAASPRAATSSESRSIGRQPRVEDRAGGSGEEARLLGLVEPAQRRSGEDAHDRRAYRGLTGRTVGSGVPGLPAAPDQRSRRARRQRLARRADTVAMTTTPGATGAPPLPGARPVPRRGHGSPAAAGCRRRRCGCSRTTSTPRSPRTRTRSSSTAASARRRATGSASTRSSASCARSPTTRRCSSSPASRSASSARTSGRRGCCWPTRTSWRRGRPGEHFRELERAGLMMYGQMTAGSWIYIGTQGILQGTYETFAELARQHFGGTLRGRVVLTAGLGGMGGAQPLAVTMNEGVVICVDVDEPDRPAPPDRLRGPADPRSRRALSGPGRTAAAAGNRSASRWSVTPRRRIPNWCVAGTLLGRRDRPDLGARRAERLRPRR